MRNYVGRLRLERGERRERCLDPDWAPGDAQAGRAELAILDEFGYMPLNIEGARPLLQVFRFLIYPKFGRAGLDIIAFEMSWALNMIWKKSVAKPFVS